jgi:N-acetyl-gamma-glutamyl-phosphate reductase
MINAGIFGATGYTGYELVKILLRHPHVQIQFLTSEQNAGNTLADVFNQLPQPLPKLIASDDAPLDKIDVAFLCLPHAAAANTAVRVLNAGKKVIDLSADFRLKDVATYESWYKTKHPAPELLAKAVYGLVEFARDQLPNADLVAVPGCYPTSILLPLQPLLANGAIAGTIIADSKSGISGAGRTAKLNTHFVEAGNNFSAYAIGRAHRHLPEIEQGFGFWSATPPDLIFSPHLLPVPRGILSTIYVPLADGWTAEKAHATLQQTYDHECFVHVLPEGQTANLAHVTHTNHCVIGVSPANPHTLIITSAIDNLLKGAAGQAVQGMNTVYGMSEDLGLV